MTEPDNGYKGDILDTSRFRNDIWVEIQEIKGRVIKTETQINGVVPVACKARTRAHLFFLKIGLSGCFGLSVFTILKLFKVI